MPPRFSYWTILVDNQPTAFRAAEIEDILPTLNRLKVKQPTAELRWFQQGQLWNTPLEAREALEKRRSEARKPARRRAPSVAGSTAKLAWAPKGEGDTRKPDRPTRSDWKPRASSPRAASPSARPSSTSRAEWKPRGAGPASASAKLAWKPPATGSKPSSARPAWRPKGEAGPRVQGGKPPAFGGGRSSDGPRPEWKPKAAPPSTERKPSESQKPPVSAGDRRDRSWRPGGDHQDPRQKYKDAKKAKWTRFKQAIRARSTKRKP